MTQSIKHQLFFAHPPASVWAYLTDPDLMQLWLMKNDFKPVIGHEFTFRAGPMPAFDFDGTMHCKVLELVPFKKLSYSWKLGPGDGTFNVDSIVRWELHPKDNGTELLLHHGDFAVLKHVGIFDAMNAGWLQNMHKILKRLNETTNDTTNV